MVVVMLVTWREFGNDSCAFGGNHSENLKEETSDYKDGCVRYVRADLFLSYTCLFSSPKYWHAHLFYLEHVNCNKMRINSREILIIDCEFWRLKRILHLCVCVVLYIVLYFLLKDFSLKLKLIILISLYLSISLIFIIIEESAFMARINSKTDQFNPSFPSVNIKKCSVYVKQKEREKKRESLQDIHAQLPFLLLRI